MEMEMEREIEWKAAEEEEEGGAWQEIKQRKRGKMGREAAAEVVNAGDNSVYYDEDKVVDSNGGANGLKLGEADKSDSEESSQSGSSAENGANEINHHDNIVVEETSENAKNEVTANGSNSGRYSEITSANGSKKIVDEIQGPELVPGQPSKAVVEEYDVERVLEEQETHDLFCPNCHSCITKRVILRKRKRTSREPLSDLPPQKVPHVPGANTCPPATTQHEDRVVFRCLSCFYWFIPSEGGFNIFSWVSSLCGSDSSKGPTGAGAPLLSGSSTVLSGGPSSGVDSSPTVPIEGGLSGTESEGTSTGASLSNGKPAGSEAQGIKPGYTPPTFSEGPSAGISHPDGELVGNQSQGNKPALSPPIFSEGTAAGGSYPSGPLAGNKTREEQPSYTPPAFSEGNMPGIGVKPPSLDENFQINGIRNAYMPPTVPYVPPGNMPGIGVKPPSLDENFLINGIRNTYLPPTFPYVPPADGISKPVSTITPTAPTGTQGGDQQVQGGSTPGVDISIPVREPGREVSRRGSDWDVLKSIVYGGLIESITSLGVVSSAAGTGSSTLNVCALGLANLVGGLFIITHDLSELRSAHDTEATTERVQGTGRYWEKLGKREHFKRHMFFAILSHIIFGLLPAVVYGFTFRESDNKEHKLIAVAASSLFCVALLAIGKAHVRPEKDYFKSIFYYLGIAVPASGLSYVAGVMIDRLMVELGLFIPNAPPTSPPASIALFGQNLGASAAF